ncbi:hypothetical protein V1477_000417 [Vespula maculifrons]|uniref:Uncharacterized protein n=1 Tax=Vespula maculifrons TaxID=7453 RepID=A0ABD2D2U6_VESMC
MVDINGFRKYYRPRSHHLEVAASGDPRANGDSTLKSTIRDAFPLRELRASQQTGDIAPPSTPSASDISRHDRSCLSFGISKNKTKSSVGLNLAFANTHARAGRHARECFPYHSRTEARRHTLPAYNKNYMQRGSINFRCIASTTDPGPTAWRLLYLGTRGLTSISVGLLFAPANTTSLSADKGVSVLPILPVFASGNRL